MKRTARLLPTAVLAVAAPFAMSLVAPLWGSGRADAQPASAGAGARAGSAAPRSQPAGPLDPYASEPPRAPTAQPAPTDPYAGPAGPPGPSDGAQRSGPPVRGGATAPAGAGP